jgi:lysine 2,3-aminomutase
MLKPPLVGKSMFSNVSNEDWNDWKWQIRNSITKYEQLEKYGIQFDVELKNLNLPLRVTPYYLELAIKNPVLLKTIIPTKDELIHSVGESIDPLDEESVRIGNIIHRYPNRVLFLSASNCGVNCRYCTRSRLVEKHDVIISKKDWEEGLKYIRNHPEIDDVIISGGDVLTLSNSNIEYLLKEISSIEHVSIIRLGTKMITVNPMRIDNEFVEIIKKYPVFISLHVTHPFELTNEFKNACFKLSNNGAILRSQTVLMNFINNDLQIMKSLMMGLLKCRITPYYIYLVDRIIGSKHFYVSGEDGIKLINGMRNIISGLAIPTLIRDSSNGKIPLY